MSNINNMSAQTGRFLTEDNERLNLAEILGATIRTGSLYGTVAIGTTATAVRIGADNLEERHTVMIINSGDSMIFVGFDNAVTAATGIPIDIGQERVFNLDPNDPIDLFAIADVATTVKVCEVK